MDDCNRNGTWSDWINSTCSKCGNETGFLNQSRFCNNPKPLGNGTNCTDVDGNPAIEEYRTGIYCNVSCPGK